MMSKVIKIVREKLLAPRTLKWTAGVLAVVVPGTVAAVNLPKLWNKPASVAEESAEKGADSGKSAAKNDPFSSGKLGKRGDKPAKKFDVERYNESVKKSKAGGNPFSADAASSTATATDGGDPYERYPADRGVVRTSYDDLPADSAEETDLERDPIVDAPKVANKKDNTKKKPSGGAVRATDVTDEPNVLDADAPGALPADAESIEDILADPQPLEAGDIDDYGRDADKRLPATSPDPFSGGDAPVDSPSGIGRSAAAAAAGAAAGAAIAAGRPGDEKLEGAQKPVVTIEKFAPDEIQIGKEALFEIAVRNEGKVAAHDVQVIDEVPQGTKLVNTEPAAEVSRDGQLVWSLATLQPGEERLLAFHVVPTEEGDIGSVARVMFTAQASVRTVCTRPKLALEVEAPQQVLIGERLALTLHASNPGTGASTGVLIEATLPDALEHQAGAELEYELGDLKPNQSRDLDLALKAVKPGRVTLNISARGDANLIAQQQVEVEVLAPALAVGLTGAKRRYLEREASFVVTVTNPGTAPAQDIELTTYLPQGIKFVKADNFGEYDAQTRAVRWSLAELPPGETGEVTLVAIPTVAGEQKVLIESAAARGLSDKQEYPIQVEGVAAILFEVADVNDPVDEGEETTYEIRVVNQGSKAATDVRVVLSLPDGLEPIDAEGPVKHGVEENQVVFDALPQLAPKADTTYQVRVKATSPGDRRVSVQLQTNEMRTPVTKEESTHVLPAE